MRKIAPFFSMAFTVLSLFFLSACTTEQGAKPQVSQPRCQETFKQYDIGNKGYLTESDFMSWYQDQGSHHAEMGLAPTGSGSTSFASADTDGDNRLTVKEFCAWVNRP